MPELPEVEITRRLIEPLLVGRRIASVRTTADSYFFLTKPASLRRNLKGRSVTCLRRHGKYLIADLDDGKRLVLHLGMSGQIFSSEASSARLLSARQRSLRSPEQPRGFEPDKHTHIRLLFEDCGPEVFFRDIRKFGKVRLLGRDDVEPRLARLGVDALAVSAEDLLRASGGRKTAVKNLLLDQSVCAGIGNIYADEALFLAGIRPTLRVYRLSRADYEQLVEALKNVLLRAIETGGSSISNFVAPDGRDGSYQDERLVYAREGEPCRTCAEPIRRIVLAQRSTHYCRHCQR